MKYYDITFDNTKYYDVIVADLSSTLVLTSKVFMDNFNLQGKNNTNLSLSEYLKFNQFINNTTNSIKLDNSKIHYERGLKEEFYNENKIKTNLTFNIRLKEKFKNVNSIDIKINSLNVINSNIRQTNKIKAILTTPNLRTLEDILSNNQTLADISDMVLQEFYFKDVTLRKLNDILNDNQTLDDVIDMTLQEFYLKIQIKD